jgi:hypothetical protein
VEPVLPKVIFLETPPDWMWDAIVQGPDRVPRQMLDEMDHEHPLPMVFENFMADGSTLTITMTMDMWNQLVETN